MTSANATIGGSTVPAIRRPSGRRAVAVTVGASSPASRVAMESSRAVSLVSLTSSAGMAADLLPEPVGDRDRQLGHLRRLDAPLAVDAYRVLRHDAAGPGRHQQHP